MMQFTLTRTYETIIDIDSDNYEEALTLLSETDIYAIEMEQCCCVDEVITDESGDIVKNINLKS